MTEEDVINYLINEEKLKPGSFYRITQLIHTLIAKGGEEQQIKQHKPSREIVAKEKSQTN